MTKEQAKDKVTVTVTKNGEQVFSTTENIVFIVGEHTGLMATACNLLWTNGKIKKALIF